MDVFKSKIEKLLLMHNKGLITEDEYEKEKQELLDEV